MKFIKYFQVFCICIITLIIITSIYIPIGKAEYKTSNSEVNCSDSVFEILRNMIINNNLSIAEKDATQLLELGENCKIKGFGLLAEIYFLQDRDEDYINSLKKLEDLAPKRAELIADLLENTSEIYRSAAIGVYEGNMYSDSKYKDNFIRAEILLLQVQNTEDGRDRLKNAEKLIEEILNIDPHNCNALMLMGRCCMEELRLRRKECKDDPSTKYEVKDETIYDLASDYFIEALNSKIHYVRSTALRFLKIIAQYYYFAGEETKLQQVSDIILLYDPKNNEILSWREDLTNKPDEKSHRRTLHISENGKRELSLEEIKSLMGSLKLSKDNNHVLTPEEIKEMESEAKVRMPDIKIYRWYEQMHDLEPNNPYITLFLAREYIKLKEEGVKGYEGKIENLLKELLAINPDYTEARYELGKYYYKDNQKNKAMEEFEKVENSVPGLIDIKYRKILNEKP